MTYNGLVLEELGNADEPKLRLVWNDGDMAAVGSCVVGKLRDKFVAFNFDSKDSGSFRLFDHCADYPTLETASRYMTADEIMAKFVIQGSTILRTVRTFKVFAVDKDTPYCLYDYKEKEWLAPSYVDSLGYTFLDGTPLKVGLCSMKSPA